MANSTSGRRSNSDRPGWEKGRCVLAVDAENIFANVDRNIRHRDDLTMKFDNVFARDDGGRLPR
jgi:hypothetical protein